MASVAHFVYNEETDTLDIKTCELELTVEESELFSNTLLNLFYHNSYTMDLDETEHLLKSLDDDSLSEVAKHYSSITTSTAYQYEESLELLRHTMFLQLRVPFFDTPDEFDINELHNNDEIEIKFVYGYLQFHFDYHIVQDLVVALMAQDVHKHEDPQLFVLYHDRVTGDDNTLSAANVYIRLKGEHGHFGKNSLGSV